MSEELFFTYFEDPKYKKYETEKYTIVGSLAYEKLYLYRVYAKCRGKYLCFRADTEEKYTEHHMLGQKNAFLSVHIMDGSITHFKLRSVINSGMRDLGLLKEMCSWVPEAIDTILNLKWELEPCKL